MSTVLITGGHGGIGFEGAKELVSKYRSNVVLAGRSPELMANAAKELQALAPVKVTQLPLDVSSLASVREAAAQLKSLLDSGAVDALQAIICNAGGRNNELAYSADGYERTFATNYLGHFLLVELLVDRLAPDGRVVLTVSGTHDSTTIDGKLVGKTVAPDAIALANTGKQGDKPLGAGVRYTTSKLCMVMHAYELDRRLKKHGSRVASIAYDPGAVGGTGFLRQMPRAVQWLGNTRGFKWFSNRIGITPGDLKFSGASLATIALDPAYANASGKYIQSNALRLIELRSASTSYDLPLSSKLWDDSKQLVHLRPDEEAPQLR